MKTNQTPTAAQMAAAIHGHKQESLRLAQVKEAQDQLRRDLLAEASEDNVGIVHVFNTDFPHGGLTVAFKKCNEYKTGYMVEVAVATCSPEDAFSKKTGTVQALTKFFAGETIYLPLLMGYEVEDLNFAVKNAFMKLMGYPTY
jgi:hypothetical protein